MVCIAGAVVPGKYLRTPISPRKRRPSSKPTSWHPGLVWRLGHSRVETARLDAASADLFLAVQDTDATLAHYLSKAEWNTSGGRPNSGRRGRKRVRPAKPDGPSRPGSETQPGPLTYEVEVYQGCVRYKRGCKFCIEPKKGVPIWRTPEDIIEEVRIAHDAGVHHVRLGGTPTDTFTYMADGSIRELEYPVPMGPCSLNRLRSCFMGCEKTSGLASSTPTSAATRPSLLKGF